MAFMASRNRFFNDVPALFIYLYQLTTWLSLLYSISDGLTNLEFYAFQKNNGIFRKGIPMPKLFILCRIEKYRFML